ncbi:MAG: hypothetical protein CMC83_05100 [Flavobacteriaceae bacterium]|nr:hypothetical protein [Flavobacteriaceae bacterium]
MIFFTLVIGCSRKKDRFINRNWHMVNTKYNVLYNGNLVFDLGLVEIERANDDNYWGILPIERLNISNKIKEQEDEKNSNFYKAEQKAVKAVQTHGMNIRGKEKNTQIDDAYILLGKARYFNGKFISALEAFNYILYKYPESSNINLAKIWRAKVNVRLNNHTIALKNLTKLSLNTNLSKNEKWLVYSTLAQIQINLKNLSSAHFWLEKATNKSINKSLDGRLNFIKGQLYSLQQKKDSANIFFQKVIDLKRKVPRIYRVNAYLEQIRNVKSSIDGLSIEEFINVFQNDRENRPFLDRIFHFSADYYQSKKQDSLAMVYYKKSLNTKSKDKYLNALNFHNIADYYYNNSNYLKAESYYDSTLINYEKSNKAYRLVKKRYDNLQDIIYYENITKVNDSILSLSAMSDEDQKAYFEQHILNMKTKRENLSVAAGKKISSKITKSSSPAQGGFYFYQTSSIAYGKQEFIRIWGDRDLEDNWRFSRTASALTTLNDANKQLIEVVDMKNLTADFYISRIPRDSLKLDSIKQQRDFAYFKLGQLYKNKFEDYERSIKNLKKFLESGSQRRLILPAKYNLFKSYNLTGREDLAEDLKRDILVNYPESLYSKAILNPSNVLIGDGKSPKERYKLNYQLFLNGNYIKAIEGCEIDILQFEGDDIVPKLEFLKANAIAKLYGFKEYKSNLERIMLNYPSSEEGLQAKYIIENTLKLIESKDFVEDKLDSNFKTIFTFESNDFEGINEMKSDLSKLIDSEEVFKLSLSEDIYDLNTTFVVVHGLKSIDGAIGFVKLLQPTEIKIDPARYFAISSANYKTLQIHKNLEKYLKIIKN